LNSHRPKGSLDIVGDGIRVVEVRVHELQGEVGRVRCTGRPGNRYGASARWTRGDVKGESGNKREGKEEGTELGEHGEF